MGDYEDPRRQDTSVGAEKLRQVQVQLLPLLSALGLPWRPSSQLQSHHRR